MKSLARCATVLCAGIVALILLSHSNAGEDDFSKLLKNLRSKEKAEREKAAKAILEQHKQRIKALIDIVKEEYEKEKVWYNGPGGTPKNIAIDVLGKLRATEAIPILLKTIVPKPGQEAIYEEEGNSSASSALSKIGVPAARAIMRELVKDLEKKEPQHGKERREAYCGVLMEVCGGCIPPEAGQVRRYKFAREAVRLRIDYEKDAKKKANLEKALKYIDHHIEIRSPRKYALTIELDDKGVISLNGSKVTSEEMKNKLKEEVKDSPRKKEGDAEASLLKVLVKTKGDVRFDAVSSLLKACNDASIKHTYHAHPDGGDRPDLKLEPHFYTQRVITLQEVRIKLLWIEKNSFRETKKHDNGRTLLKIRDIKFPYVTDNGPGKVTPDFKLLYKYLCKAKDNFKPTKSFKTLPVMIDARELVHFKHVLYALKECNRAGIPSVQIEIPVTDSEK
jgi:biopolymer transport protein ExbD